MALKEEEAAVYDRQLRVWGVETQRKYAAAGPKPLFDLCAGCAAADAWWGLQHSTSTAGACSSAARLTPTVVSCVCARLPSLQAHCCAGAAGGLWKAGCRGACAGQPLNTGRGQAFGETTGRQQAVREVECVGQPLNRSVWGGGAALQ